jgi:outer membrane protein OmpA-like peptidoglycan-associated protein
VLSHERYVIETLDVVVPDGGGPPQDIHWDPEASEYSAMRSLERVPLTIQTVRSEDERPLDSSVRLLGAVVMPSRDTGPDGELTVDVRPGAWEVLASAEGTGIEGATVDVGANEDGPSVLLRLGEAKVAVGALDVVLQEVVQFETGSAQLLPLSWGLLDEVAYTLQANPGLVRLAIEGHTDNTGSDEVNRTLSLARAEAVRAYLVAQGVAPDRLAAEGYGPSVPVADNDTEAGRTANRRVAFRIVEQSEAHGAVADATEP